MVQPKQPAKVELTTDTVGQYIFAKPKVNTFPDMSANYQQTVLIPAQQAQAALEAAQAAEKAAEAQAVQNTYQPTYINSGASQAAIQYAQSLVSADQWQCLYALWNRESGWNPNAVNRYSGAAGIAQSLGHGYVPLGDYVSQINWGLNYIAASYGSPCNAWNHSQNYNWY